MLNIKMSFYFAVKRKSTCQVERQREISSSGFLQPKTGNLLNKFYVFCFCALLSCDIGPHENSCKYPDSCIKGMNIFFLAGSVDRNNLRNSFDASDFTESLIRLKSDGINTVYLVPYYYSTDESDDTIDSTWRTIPESQLVSVISLSKVSGFNVVLKPHIDLENGVPRYKISPKDYFVWQLHYKKFINKYLMISKNNGLTEFVIGTELDNIVEHSDFHDYCDSIRH